MMIKSYVKITAILFAALFCMGLAQSMQAQDLQKRYKVINRSLGMGSEPHSIHLNEAEGVGIAWINGKTFTQGSIEFDIKGKDEIQRSFVGIAFHGLNDTTYEAVYFRPFNFRATDPLRKAHAVQYIANPKYDWPKLRADFPNKYEQPISPAPDPTQWFHVRITVENEIIRVFVNSSSQPSLSIVPLVKTSGKMIGYWVGNTSGGDWKNFKIDD